MKKKIILLIGSEGLIGKYLKHFYNKKKDVNLVVLDKKKNLDISDRKSLRIFFKKNSKINYIINASGKNDHITNNRKKNLFEDDETLNEYLKHNVIGPKNIIELSIQHCKSLRSIIHFSSLYGNKSPYHPIYSEKKSLSYCISKHAMEGLTKYYATLLAPKKIRINNIRIGGIKSTQPKSFLNNFLKKIPFKELAKMKDLANTVDFLCSSKSEYIIGENISLEGGYNLW